jgi:tripartite-type tricarboxylate transporter receptor subunit TctC
MPQVIEFIKDGRLKAIAVTPAKRWNALPDVPALGEFVPGYSSAGWYGLTAPVGTPPEIVAKLNAEMNAGLADANLKARLLAIGVEPKAMSTAEFGTFMGDEVAKWAKVIKFAALKPAG